MDGDCKVNGLEPYNIYTIENRLLLKYSKFVDL